MAAILILIAVASTGCGQCSETKGGPDDRPASACAQKSAPCRLALCDKLLIPGGSFIMGSDEASSDNAPEDFRGLERFGDPRPAHEVLLEPYYIDKYEVTVERYEDCVRAGVCDPGEARYTSLPDTDAFLTKVNHYPDHCADLGHLCPTCPVNCKSYEQARDYCRWIGRRLCTEAEWERAASGPAPGKSPYPWGYDEIDETKANVCPLGPGHVLPVDSYPEGVSAEGVFNLAGNVYEWVEGVYGEYRESAKESSDAEGDGVWGEILRVGRGGCFHTDSGYASFERTTFHLDFDWGCIGIRCCASPER